MARKPKPADKPRTLLEEVGELVIDGRLVKSTDAPVPIADVEPAQQTEEVGENG